MKKLEWQTFINRFKAQVAFSWLVYFAIGVVMFVATINTAMPAKLHIQLHQIATQDIQSPVEVVDEVATKVAQEQASADTPTSYVYQKDLAMIQVEKASDIFSAITEERNKVNSIVTNTSDQADSEGESQDQEEAGTSIPSIDQQIKDVRNKLTDSASQQISDSTLKTLLTTSEHNFGLASEIVSSSIYESMSNKIKWDDLDKVQQAALNSIPTTVDSQELHQAIGDLLNFLIVPNYVFDAAGTKQNKAEAAKAVDPVVIHQGEVIVKKGELVTTDVMRKLKAVGLLNETFNILPFIGLAIFVTFLTILIGMELIQIQRSKKSTKNLLLVYFCLFFITFVFIKLDALLRHTHLTGIEFIIPVSSGTLLMAILINKRIAAVSSIAFALCSGFIFGSSEGTSGIFDYQMAIYILFSTLAGSTVLRGSHSRPRILQTGLIISVVNVMTVLSLMLMKSGGLHLPSLGLELGYTVLSGFLSTILTSGLLPFFETVFGILSALRLIDLSNPNHPLLKKILMEAPGTYHHSIMVANLAESACEAIGANGLLARVAAYYHDIGKTKRPHFFIENLMDEENPHDKISPQLSKTIIISHPYDGAKILREHRLPKEIIDICEQHHGTTLLKFFHHKAQEEMGQAIDESEFRYPGPKAQTKEAAVVELCDSVEAAVRSMKKPNPVKIQNLVQKIFKDRLQDGQFDECDITMQELHEVQTSIFETLNGIFHQRIEYPEEGDKKAVSE
ncbi:HD family phosphohydrolase [Pullulanibacillus sp. KACC 23026]|uniref:HD family phosphohydrolase n=1 Tax=Pullulanibacillus sp. KACC 23026 TaxID=3028315 RepID=UPI0023B121AF|nr:HD family phosphohydrolase [Pullulanibacillus sp. KACC 23026]WEG14236.1 HD family phosphohydrolase [Pullulanibacillus sp. KACC 23026]